MDFDGDEEGVRFGFMTLERAFIQSSITGPYFSVTPDLFPGHMA
jgi:hypothetical protein